MKRYPALLAILFVLLMSGGLTISSAAQAGAEQSVEADALTLITTIPVGGEPDTIVVDCAGPDCSRRYDIAFFDKSTDLLHFLDGDTFVLGTEEIANYLLSAYTWLVYNRYHQQIYTLFDDVTCNNDFGFDCWEEVFVRVVAGRKSIGVFSVNEDFDSDPPSPSNTPRYGIAGFTLKQPYSEGSNNGRLFIHDYLKHNVDVVDLTADGSTYHNRQRFSYRDPETCYDQPVCTWNQPDENSLALETNHETLPADDLTDADDLYLNDGLIRVLRVKQGANMTANELQPVDFFNTFPYPNGTDGMMTAGSYDKLYVSSNLQSFEEGYVGIVSATSNQLVETVNPKYQDQGIVYVDWYDPKRVFVTTTDAFGTYDPDSSLYLYLIYDDVIVDSLELVKNVSTLSFRNMVFDPVRRRLYITHDDSITVVQVNYGAGPAAPTELRASVELKPGEATTLSTPDDSVEISFPGNAVSQPTAVTYQEIHDLTAVLISLTSKSTADSARLFEISAVLSSSSAPVTDFEGEFQQLKVNFTEKEVAGFDKTKLGLYRLVADSWELLPSSQLTSSENSVRAYITQTGTYALRDEGGSGGLPGNRNNIFLPVVVNGPSGK